MMSIEIVLAYDELNKVKELFVEYQTTMGLDLRFQSFEDELAYLPGKYALPAGRLYVATFNNNLAGCIALRAISKESCEMKRLYVRARFRGLGIGRALTEKVISDAKDMEYCKMVLDTSASMKEAISLYHKLGFIETEPYYNNPNDDIVYLELGLSTE